MSSANSIRQTNKGVVLPSIVDAIGQTPLIELTRFTNHYGLTGRIYAKCEYMNPGGSKKDRIARQIILDAKASGELHDGQTVVELTSGNTGTGLAIVCSVLGHPFVAVMSKGNSIERAKMMRSLGATVELVDQEPGSVTGQVSGGDLELVEQRTQELVKELNAFRADQFGRWSNHDAHFHGTGPEIWNALTSDDGKDNPLTAFCDYVGTAGTFSGCAAYLRPKGVRCYVVEPAGAAVLAGQKVTRPNHVIQGGGYIKQQHELPMMSSRLQNVDKDGNADSVSHAENGSNMISSLVDGYLQVTDDEAIQAARDLAKLEGIFAGFSAGANLGAAINLLRGPEKGGSVAVLICDSGLKYLSTKLWE